MLAVALSYGVRFPKTTRVDGRQKLHQEGCGAMLPGQELFWIFVLSLFNFLGF